MGLRKLDIKKKLCFLTQCDFAEYLDDLLLFCVLLSLLGDNLDPGEALKLHLWFPSSGV